MTEREALSTVRALKLAQKALSNKNAPTKMVYEALYAIKEALMSVPEGAQPAVTESHKQEPVFWYSAQEDEFMPHKIRKEHERRNSFTHKVGRFDLALYTNPPQLKPLTDEEIQAMWPLRPTDSIIQFARAIEAAHGIKGEA